ncbi:MAG: HD domain-containing protein [Chromatiales bacterium]|nr:HD domain-containing protein [Chromatiales bacterium]
MSKTETQARVPPSARLDEALGFAVNLHRQQFRKGTGIPYVSHLLAVAGLVLESGGTEDEVIGALLHDAIEDQADNWPGKAPALRAEIEKRFGPAVLAIVNACTDSDAASKPTWRERKEKYLGHLRETDSSSALLVSAADKLHNARCILADYRHSGEALWQRFNEEARTAGHQLWYYESLVTVLQERGPARIAAELGRTVATLRQLVSEAEAR